MSKVTNKKFSNYLIHIFCVLHKNDVVLNDTLQT